MRDFDAFETATFLSSTSGRVSPTVGSPSVRKTTIGRRSVERSLSASASAPSMFVPPSAARPPIHWTAASCVSFVTGTSPSRNERTPVENETIANRSPSLSIRTPYVSAARACSIFSPCIEPLVSIT